MDQKPDVNAGILEVLEKSEGALSASVPLVKAMFVGSGNGDQSNAIIEQARQAQIFGTVGVIHPVYDPNILALVFENSSSLRQCVDAYVVNIEAFGHHYVPLIDLSLADADKQIADALRAEKMHGAKNGTTTDLETLLSATEEPTEEEIAARKKSLAMEMRIERATLENFFENCTHDMPFGGPEGLRGLTRQDIEVTGNGYWEILRNGLREIETFSRLEGRTMRLLPTEPESVEVEISRRVSALKTEKQKVRKRFRKYVQVMDGSTSMVYFKEFGDPRTIDADTGKAYQTVEEAKRDRSKAGTPGQFRPATEVLQFRITSTRSPYGAPRWIGSLLAVLGNRQAEEVNFLYFENRSVPPLAVLVSGGRLHQDTAGNLKDFVENQIKGKRNFHKILILEAEGPGGDANTGKMKIELKPLTDAQQKDGLFQSYDLRNAEKVGQTFRLPKILRGDSTGQDRATADASVDFAEIQVFGPIRQAFDWVINKRIFPDLGIKYHHFRSHGPTIRDPQQLAAMIKDMVTSNILTPEEGRELAQHVFNKEFQKLDAEWTKIPIAISLAGRNAGDGGSPAGSPGQGAGNMSQPGAASTQEALGVDQSKALVASALQKIHTLLLKEEREEHAEMQAETIKVPMDLFLSWMSPTSAVE